MKKGFIIMIALLISLALFGCEKSNKLEIEGSDTLEVGFNEEYKVKLNGKEVSNDELLWTISNRSILIANGNKLIPLQEGECDITVVLKSDGSVVATKSVKVVDAIIKSVSIKSTEGNILYLDNDEFLNLEYSCEPSDVAVTPIWTSSDESIAKVDEDGLVTPVSKGTATITVTCGKATDTIEIKVKEIITEIKANLPAYLVEGQGVELSFNIDDPVITIKDDNDNETSELIGNVLFAKKIGTIKLSVKSKSQPSLNKVFDIEVKANALNSITYDNSETIKEAKDILNKLSTTQKIGQYVLATTRASDLKEDTDGVYYNDTQSKTIGKKYINDLWEGREFGNFAISGINSRDPLESLQYFQSMAKYNSQIGGFIMMSDYVAETTLALTTQLSEIGQGKLSAEEFYNYHSNYAKELKEFGVNFYFTYGYNSKDYVTDTVSTDVVTNNYYTQILRKAYADNGIMVGFTFDSLGDSEEDRNNDKITLIQMVNNNADLIAIEENISNFDGELSLVEYLRKTLNYEGLIYYNISYNDYSDEEDIAGAITTEIVNAINQGVDMFYAPVYINYRSWGESSNNDIVFAVYDNIIEAYNNNQINRTTMENALLRIINKKIKYNIVSGDNIVPEEISDYSEYNKYAESLYKNTYSISDTYQALDKTKNTVIIGSTFRDYNMGYGGSEYNFGKNLETSLTNAGYESVTLKNNLTNNADDVFASIQTTDQVVIMIQYSEYDYSYKAMRDKTDKEGNIVYDETTGEPVQEEYRAYGSFMWFDKIKELYDRGVTNITIVAVNSVTVLDSYTFLTNKICANYNYTSDFAALIDLVVNGK